MNRRTYDLEARLIHFANQTIDIAKHLSDKFYILPLAKQLVRSCTSPALNYGEAQAAESSKDFMHKMRIYLKELRETQICLKIIKLRNVVPSEKIDKALDECSQLVAIFTSSIQTKKKNLMNESKS